MEVLLTRVLMGPSLVPESGPGKRGIGVLRDRKWGHVVEAASRKERDRREDAGNHICGDGRQKRMAPLQCCSPGGPHEDVFAAKCVKTKCDASCTHIHV